MSFYNGTKTVELGNNNYAKVEVTHKGGRNYGITITVYSDIDDKTASWDVRCLTMVAAQNIASAYVNLYANGDLI